VKPRMRTLTAASIVAIACCAPARAQESTETPTIPQQGAPQKGVPSRPGFDPGVPLKLQVVISRYQDDKKVSSLPYTISLGSNGRSVSLRMGGEVPIVTSMIPQGPTSINYRNVGTSLDGSASELSGGRFAVSLTLEDSSVYPDDQKTSIAKAGDHPSFSTFRASETMILRDGQSTQYTTAADKVTGLVTKVDVTLTVLK